ncbi:MAG: hypothetical protein QOF28_2509 [Actinomycetota bacterium]|nr:hypothetical protein [Actinomycetota bacterium]
MRRIALGLLLTCALFGVRGVATASVTGSAGPVVAATSNPSGTAGWTVTAKGAVHTTGSARSYGDASHLALRAPIVGIAALPRGNGYWLLAADGGVFTYGGARFYGSTGRLHLNQPIVGIAATSSGRGYWLVARDGGIFAFGDAKFYGSTGGMRLNRPIVGMATQPTIRGYWLVASDGGIFSFGNAPFEGSTGRLHLMQPVRAIAASGTGHGYWLVASDGGIFAFGDAKFYGSTAGKCVTSVGIMRTTSGYIIAGADGSLRQMTAAVEHIPSSCPAPTTASANSCPASFLSRVAQLTNAARAAAYVAPLTLQGQLMSSAAQRSRAQAANNTMSHDGWDTTIRASGYPYGWWGENVGYGYTTADSVMAAWMNSPGHRENILNPNYRDLGVGCAYSVSHVPYWTQDFGRPA